MQWGSAVTYFGSTTLPSGPVKFGIKDADRLKHLCVLGKVDTSRSAFLAHVALQDIRRNTPVVLLDLSGDTSHSIVERLDEDEMERLVYLDVGDADYPYSFNVLEDIRRLPLKEDQQRLLSEMLGRIYGVENTAFLDSAAEELLRRPDATITSLFSIVTDAKARASFFEGSDDALAVFESLLAEDESLETHFSEQGKYIAKDTLVRNIFGQHTSKFSLADASRPAPIILIDLSRVRIYPTRTTPIVRAWVDIARVGGNARDAPVSLLLYDCLRYLDEGHIDTAFSSQDIAITVADASFGEGEKEKREKALSRCGSITSFAAHTSDRALIERAFYPYVNPEELHEVGDTEMLAALTIDAVRAKPFFGNLLTLPARTNTSYQDALLVSRERYTTPRLSVDTAIRTSLKKKTTDKEQERDIDDDDDDTLNDDDDSFASTFRSIFKPQQPSSPPAAQKPSPGAGETKPPHTSGDAQGGRTNPPEIPEDKLKEMLYVHPRLA